MRPALAMLDLANDRFFDAELGGEQRLLFARFNSLPDLNYLFARKFRLPVMLALDPSQPLSVRVVRFRVAGGTAGSSYLVTCDVTTSAGQTDQRTLQIPVRDR